MIVGAVGKIHLGLVVVSRAGQTQIALGRHVQLGWPCLPVDLALPLMKPCLQAVLPTFLGCGHNVSCGLGLGKQLPHG